MSFWNELISLFLFQSLQAVTTRRNCQLDNAEESLHVITTGIIIGILLKRLLQVTSARQLNFFPRSAVIDFMWKKKGFWHEMTNYGSLRAISSRQSPKNIFIGGYFNGCLFLDGKHM